MPSMASDGIQEIAVTLDSCRIWTTLPSLAVLVVVAPPDGLRGAVSKAYDPLAWYAYVGAPTSLMAAATSARRRTASFPSTAET